MMFEAPWDKYVVRGKIDENAPEEIKKEYEEYMASKKYTDENGKTRTIVFD